MLKVSERAGVTTNLISLKLHLPLDALSYLSGIYGTVKFGVPACCWLNLALISTSVYCWWIRGTLCYSIQKESCLLKLHKIHPAPTEVKVLISSPWLTQLCKSWLRRHFTFWKLIMEKKPTGFQVALLRPQQASIQGSWQTYLSTSFCKASKIAFLPPCSFASSGLLLLPNKWKPHMFYCRFL